MSDIKKSLRKDGEKIRLLKAPEALEERLRSKLNEAPTKQSNHFKKPFLIAASFIFVFFFTYQFDTIAFYGKKILGYDDILTDSLSELNEQGKGQVIGKSADLPDGGKLTLDGLMLDDNQLILFYTLYDPKQKVEDIYLNTRGILDGFLGEITPDSGRATTSDDNTSMTIAQSFEPPNPFARELTFRLSYDNDPSKNVEIPFELDRSKAMMTKYKQKINQTIKTSSADYVFEEMVATPTQTVFTGKIFVEDKKAWHSEMTSQGFEIQLRADGKLIQKQGQGNSSGLFGNTFDVKFEPLDDVEELTIILESGLTTNESEQKIPLKQGTFKLDDQTISIDEIKKENGKIEILLTADDNFSVLEAELTGTNGKVGLESVNDTDYRSTEDGLVKEFVLSFDGTVKGESFLRISKYAAVRPNGKSIVVPIK
ncbi:DUF4179 domain-containing protein [Pseudalkalibacillus berkeleyi]|uniref:DUF4179 domain-containing protein n=1 Tax=Pseudalkalibacillus berkeleyi TaxID=1069813 RepID=A0ABS9H5D4_9BACL|nr:DUF4179 domain-containing protein [Pseudalkalibacillus berkeleyi]MCF6139170.1 DUF4179 domain-containing protein [Pseudalkalibacillus berkeleyi]